MLRFRIRCLPTPVAARANRAAKANRYLQPFSFLLHRTNSVSWLLQFGDRERFTTHQQLAAHESLSFPCLETSSLVQALHGMKTSHL
jgi:hypothetical protein